MCLDPVTASIIAATAQIGGAAMQAQSAISAGNANARALEAQGLQELDAANVTSNNIRYEGTRRAGAITAIQAASGVALTGQTAGDVAGESAANVELDALRALYSGRLKKWGLDAQAKLTKFQAKQQAASAIIGGVTGAATSLIGMPRGAPSSGGALNASKLAPLPGGEPRGFYVVR